MKKIITIIGSNGVGKSTTAGVLLKRYCRTAYVDSEWCRAINPFSFTEETKKTVINNIYSLFKNYLLCEDINNIIFTYGFHRERKEIFDTVIESLKKENVEFNLYIIVLKCSLEENIKRMKKDNREEERIKRGIENTYSFYNKYDYPAIDTTYLSPEEVADKILNIISKDEC